MFKSRRDYKKCLSILDGCKTFGQLNTTMNLIFNYGKMYGFNGYWRRLDIKSTEMWEKHVDMLDYKERLEDVTKTPNDA